MALSEIRVSLGRAIGVVVGVVSAVFLSACSPKEDSTADGALEVVATVTDVGSLVSTIGGEHVSVEVLVGAKEDPHAVELRPSAVTAIGTADLVIEVGLGLEGHWWEDQVDILKITDAKRLVLAPSLGDPIQEDASGDADHDHAEGNPHFLIDPGAGVRAAVAITDKLTELKPEASAEFAANLEGLLKSLSTVLVGEELSDPTALAAALDAPESGALSRLKDSELRVIADHDLWAYLARRVGLEVVGFVESAPGVVPSARALGELVSAHADSNVAAVLASGQVDPETVQFVADRLNVPVIDMAPQTGSRPGCESYTEFVAYNLSALAAALPETSSEAEE